jgi:hypothetical protein
MESATAEASKPEGQSTTTTPQNTKKSMVQNIFSLSTLSSLMAAFYVYFAFSNLVNLMYPLRNIPQDVLQSYGKDRMVFPFWNWDEKSSVGRAELGLRVYLSTQEHFSVNFFQSNDEFEEKSQDGDDANIDQADDPGVKRVDGGNSFLLWSEDNDHLL